MIKRTFHKGCEWCGATGYVSQWHHEQSTSAITNVCPVCQGAGVVQVVEEDYGEVNHCLNGEIPGSVFLRSGI